MIELGKIQTLYMVKRASFGVYLNDEPGKREDSILLPKKQVPREMQMGDAIDVFVYKDSEDRLIATTNSPKLTLGELAELEVVSF